MSTPDYERGGWRWKYIIFKKRECPRCHGSGRGTGMGRIFNSCRHCRGKGWTKGDLDPSAVYFVLRLDKDPHARKAALAYAESVKTDNPRFASDIRNMAKAATPEKETP